MKTALVVRAERLDQARQLSSAALGLLYQRQIEFAQQQALDAQAAFDQFNQSHAAPLGDGDQHVQAQLRLNLDFALVRLTDLKGRQEQAQLAPALLEVSGIEFQIVDEPRAATRPGGGERAAITIAAVALAAGAALGTLLVLLATLLRARGPRSAPAEADHARVGTAAPASDRSRRVEATTAIGR